MFFSVLSYQHHHTVCIMNTLKVTFLLLLNTLLPKCLSPLPILPVFVAWNDTISQVKLAITRTVICAAPPQFIHSKLTKRAFSHSPLCIYLECGSQTQRTLGWNNQRGPSHLVELTLHSHGPRTRLNIKWLITVKQGDGASFVNNGGGVAAGRAPTLMCHQDLDWNHKEQNAKGRKKCDMYTVILYARTLKQTWRSTQTNTDTQYNRQALRVFLSPAPWCRWMPLAADPESTLGHYNKQRGPTKPRKWRAWEENYSRSSLGKQPWHSHLSQLHQS